MMKQMTLKLAGLSVLLLSASPVLADEAIINNMSGSQTNTVQIAQYGGEFNANFAEIYQDYSALSSHASITQSGAGDQYAYVYQNGMGNDVSVMQAGAHGTAFIHEGSACYDSSATITQGEDSVNAHASISQNHEYGYGYNNSASIDQDSVTGDQATISQIGGNDFAAITQQYSYGPENASTNQTGEGNLAIISQEIGSFDQTNIVQNGNGNQSTVQQFSTYLCSASVEQNGNSNTAAIDQLGDMKVATVIQWGSGNSTSIIQH